MTFRIQTLNAISPLGLKHFPESAYEVGNDVEAPHALLLRSANLHDVGIPDTVEAVARAGAGTNNIPIADYSAQGIPVFNTPGANANAVKELTLAGIFLAARNIIDGAAFAHRLTGTAAEMNEAVEKGKKQFVGFELPGRTLAVIGLGAIGVEVANSACALGMKVMGYDPQVTVDNAWKLSSHVERVTSPEQMYRQADIVTVHVPLIDETRGMVGADQIALMKPSAVILNFSRAPIVDEEALVAALEADKLGGYVCDFPSPNLNTRSKCVTLPHLGASTYEAEENCALMAVDQLRDYLENGIIRNSVNFPTIDLPRSAGSTRLGIAHSNVPNMVGQISALLAEAGLNIADLLNRSKNELAYTLVDVEGSIPQAVIDEIRTIAEVLSVRVIAS
ncbi:MAG: phosphoglycerate dehydrogenase [Propionibacteriaceae bacterium]|nr:phosphoglycerate dehydrogenase [Propionibacteriaceae bacterium]